MKISCVIKNTRILDQLHVLVKDISDSLILNNIAPTPSNIFDQVRKLGVEVDLTTVGAIYAQDLSGTDKTYMSVKDVEEEVGADFNRTVKKIIQLDKGTKELGKRSPAQAVATALANIFVERNAPVQKKTLMRQMQDTVLRGLKRQLPADNPMRNSVSAYDVASEALMKMDAMGVTDLKGQLNSLEDVLADVKTEIKEQIRALKSQSAPASTVAKYEDMMDNVLKSVYQLFLSRTDAKNIINEAIKDYKDGVYTKADKNGEVQLDYNALSGHIKSEQELRTVVTEALTDAGFDQRQVRIITDSLAQEMKDKMADIYEKAANKLQSLRDAKGRKVVSKSDLERLAQLSALGAFGSAHESLVYELLGVDENGAADISAAKEIADEVNRMRDAGFSEKNERVRALNEKVDNLIAEARERDAPFIYRATKFMSGLMGMANLAILNNIKNRIENNVSGRMENLNAFVGRGGRRLPSEVVGLAKARKKELISNGGLSEGELNQVFQGDSSMTDAVREKIAGWLAGDNQQGQRIVNWWYNQIMGTAALNGVDSYNKVLQTWSRFIGNMEQMLVDKGEAKNNKEAQRLLHQTIFGDAWKQAAVKAQSMVDAIEKDGSVLKSASPEMIQLLAADIAKAELVNNKLVSQEELDAAWNASYKAAGRALGHVSNNMLSTALQKANSFTQQKIREQVSKGTPRGYKVAAGLMALDLLVNKIIFKFAGGGSNWVVLNVEKTGIGLILGAVKKAYTPIDHISNMKPKEIEEQMYSRQVQNDKMARGAVGMAVNGLMLLAAYSLFGGDDPENKRRKNDLLRWVANNRWANKYLNVLPLYITGYLAKEQQEKAKGGLAGTFNKYQYSPLRNWEENFTNRSNTYSFDTQIEKALGGIFSGTKDQGKRQENVIKGWKTAGQALGGFFNFNPLPYRPIKDMKDVYEGVLGEPTKADRDKKSKPPKTIEDAMLSGYLKYGMFDW